MLILGGIILTGNFAVSAAETAPEDASSKPPFRTAAEVLKARRNLTDNGRAFDLEVVVIYNGHHPHCFAMVEDATGKLKVRDGTENHGTLLREDTVVRLRGHLVYTVDKLSEKSFFVANYESAETLPKAPPPIPVIDWKYDSTTNSPYRQRVRISGILRDVFMDEVDPQCIFVTVNSNGHDVHGVFSAEEATPETTGELIGFEVSLTGFLNSYPGRVPQMEGRARLLSHLVYTHPKDIRPVSPVAADPFAVPELPLLVSTTDTGIRQLGRRRISGTVITRWSEHNLMLETDDHRLIYSTLPDGRVPARGDAVTVSGVPESAVYFIRLNHARWKPIPKTQALTEEPARPIEIKALFSAPGGLPCYAIARNGMTVRVRGRYLGPSSPQPGIHEFNLEDGGCVLPVDCSSIPEVMQRLPVDSVLEVTGTCIVRMEQIGSLPQVCGLFLVANRETDIVLLRRPAWWTFGKFMAAISLLMAVLVGVLVWSILLRRVSERRGQELANEKLAVVESELKVYERTRLAIELHDLLSQMLSGISMQIDTARKFFDSSHDKALRHLNIANRTLLACRESLHYCLWDLRNRALDNPDMEAAIRETLAPHLEDASLVIRFTVPRERLTENTAHAILCIIRELTVNALRHGRASVIRIAGCIEDERILFSVADNGDGFDPGSAPGMAQGHFGLQGIRERVDGFRGEMSVASRVGSGSKITISMKLPQEA